MTKPFCNLCGNDKFGPVGKRSQARCQSCQSLERTRLMWLYIQNRVPLDPAMRILHFAPEEGLYSVITDTTGKDNYICSDISQDRYKFAKIFKTIDLTCDLEQFDDGEFDLIIHSHVLEHVPCNVAYVLYHIHRILKPTGKHICVITFMGGAHDECFDDLPADEATRRFGQADHVRRFGTRHLASTLGCIINLPESFDAEADFGDETLSRHNIPDFCRKGFQPSTVLCLGKEDYRLLPGR